MEALIKYDKMTFAFANRKKDEMTFSFDYIPKNKSKKFFNANKMTIIEILKTDNHVYEILEPENQHKLYFDLDYSVKPEFNNFTSKDEMLQLFIESLPDELKYKKIIILDSSREDKYSYHVIFPTIVMYKHNMKTMGEALIGIKDNLRNAIDFNAYGICLRCINQSKYDLSPVLKSIGEVKIEDTLISCYNDNEVEFCGIEKEIQPINNTTYEDVNNKISYDQMIELIDMVDNKLAVEYETWIKMMFVFKSYSLGNDGYKLFDYFSTKSNKYDQIAVYNKWNQHKTHSKKITIGSLFYYAKKGSPIEFNNFLFKYPQLKPGEEQTIINDHIEVNVEYLLKDAKLSKCEVSKYINKYLNSDVTGLIVKSAYDTGKTTLVREIVNKYKDLRILFISYRITLTENIYGSFINFKKYYEEIDADHLICQVDSLLKIPNPDFDIVIMDESESCLNHLSCDTLKNKESILHLMVKMCNNAKKVIYLDGDVDERTKIFALDTCKNVQMLTNIYKKISKHFVFHTIQETFNNLIDIDINNNVNVIVVCMSETEARIMYEKYKYYRCIMYTGTSDDTDKKLLAQATNIWPNHQIIIYTPAIESGVSIDVVHFDKVYCILSAVSTSQRGLNQMIHRVRKLTDQTCHTYLNGIPPFENQGYLFNYNDVKNEYDGDTYNMYDKIMLHNRLEYLNKKSNTFLPGLIKMILAKGYTYEILKEITDENKAKIKIKELKKEIKQLKQISTEDNKEDILSSIKDIKDQLLKLNKNLLIEKQKRKQENENEITVKQKVDLIFEAPSTDKATADELLKLQQEKNMTEANKVRLQKYLYEKTFDIKLNNEDDSSTNIETLKYFMGNLGMVKKAKQAYKEAIADSEFYENKINILLSTIFNTDYKQIYEDKFNITNHNMPEYIRLADEYLRANKVLFNLEKNIKIESSNKLINVLNKILKPYGSRIVISGTRRSKTSKEIITHQIEMIDEVASLIKKMNKKQLSYLDNNNDDFINEYGIGLDYLLN